MGTVVNGNIWSGACVDGNIVSGLVKNGVVFYKKDTTPSVLYKRRIMAGDNLKGKTIYSDFPSDWLNNMNTRMSNVETIVYIHVNDSNNESIYEMTMPDNGTSYYQKCIPVENFNSNFGNIYYCKGSDVNSCVQNPQLKYLSDKDYLVQTIISDNPSYRHIYIEDPNIRPLQVGDKVVSGTKFYGVVPDDYNANNINSIIYDANNNSVGYFSFYENTAELWIRASSSTSFDYMFQKNPYFSVNNSQIISQTEYTVGSITNETNPNFAYLLVDTTTLGE